MSGLFFFPSPASTSVEDFPVLDVVTDPEYSNLSWSTTDDTLRAVSVMSPLRYRLCYESWFSFFLCLRFRMLSRLSVNMVRSLMCATLSRLLFFNGFTKMKLCYLRNYISCLSSGYP